MPKFVYGNVTRLHRPTPKQVQKNSHFLAWCRSYIELYLIVSCLIMNKQCGFSFKAVLRTLVPKCTEICKRIQFMKYVLVFGKIG